MLSCISMVLVVHLYKPWLKKFLTSEADGAEEKEGPGEEAKFQPQMGMPAEEDLNSWSHHHSVDTIDDELMREVRAY